MNVEAAAEKDIDSPACWDKQDEIEYLKNELANHQQLVAELLLANVRFRRHCDFQNDSP